MCREGDSPEQSIDVASWKLSSEFSNNLLEGDQTRNPTLTLSRKSLYHLTSQPRSSLSFLHDARKELFRIIERLEWPGRKAAEDALSPTRCPYRLVLTIPSLYREKAIRQDSAGNNSRKFVLSVPLTSHFNM